MGFFASGQDGPKRVTGISAETLYKLGCKGCPLNNAELQSPKMEATGSAKPIVYMLGEAPGKDEDEEDKQFVGKSGQLLRKRIPRDWKDDLRWNNVINCRPPENRTPEKVEQECCKPRVETDIARTKPIAIFGFGGVPLGWATGHHFISMWRGRRVPVSIGGHSCWYYPMFHPSYILRLGAGGDRMSEEERMFALDLKKAFAEVERLPKPIVHTKAMAEKNVRWVTGHEKGDLQTVLDFLEWAGQQPRVGLDYETNGIRPYGVGRKILTVAIGTDADTLAFPLEHRQAGWKGTDLELVRDAYCTFLMSPTRKAVHSLAFELEWTAYVFGKKYLWGSLWDDSMSQASILDERKGDRKPGCFALDFLTMQYFGISIKDLSSVNTKRLDDEPVEDVLRYNGIDAKYHYLLTVVQEKRLAYEKLSHVYAEHLRRIPTVVLTQLRGVPVDQKVTRALEKKYASRIEKTLKAIADDEHAQQYKRKTGKEFNPESGDDVVYLCKKILKSTVGELEDGRYTTEEAALKQIKTPITNNIIAIRKARKNHSTYILPLMTGSPILWPDGLLHPVLNTVFARTGRLSSEDPNEQNFPKRDEEAKEIRRQMALDGYYFVSFDYGQIEARVAAMASNDKTFVKMLWERYDVHMEWAQRIAHAYPRRIGGKEYLNDKKVMKDFRTDIKNQWTFPLFFGATLESASGYLEIPAEVLAPLYKEFWRTFTGVRDWQEKTLTFYKEHGYVECLTGRRRHGPLSLNKVINTPIQGTTADIVLDRMSAVSEDADAEGIWDRQPIMNVHDDLTFMIPKTKQLDDHAEWIIARMLKVPYKFVNVPITVEMSIGDNWCDMEEVGAYSSDKWFKEMHQ